MTLIKSQERAHISYAADLGGLELLEARYHRQNFSRHVHEGFCIGVIDTGAQSFYRGGANHIAPQNSIILVNADQVHDGRCAAGNGWSYRAIYPVPAMLAQVSAESFGPRSGAPWFAEPVVHDPWLAQQLRGFFDLLSRSDNQLQRQTAWFSVMTSLLQRHGGRPGQLPPTLRAPSQVRRVRDYIDAHFQRNLTLNELASLAGRSPFYLARLFQRHVGLPPHSYQITRRVQFAKGLIRQGESLADVATTAGFTDQSHLTRHFKKVLGVTPGRFH